MWEIVDALSSVMLSHSRQDIASSNFYALSLDEASALGRTSFLCVHLYILRNWRRTPIFLGLMEVGATSRIQHTTPPRTPPLAFNTPRPHARTHARTVSCTPAQL